MYQPTISVITVVRNDNEGLARTISSVTSQCYSNIEYIVVDGDSTDGTKNTILKNEHLIDKTIVESDVGIYHAMNKAISVAKGEWLIFMNAGDCFTVSDSLSSAAKVMTQDTDVVFSDWIYRDSDVRVTADFDKLNVRHQSVIYKKTLHEIYGNYLVGKGVSISDYIFFLSIRHLNWQYHAGPMSVCERHGISAQPAHFYQRILSECLFGVRSKWTATAILLLYPIYRFIKRSIMRIK